MVRERPWSDYDLNMRYSYTEDRYFLVPPDYKYALRSEWEEYISRELDARYELQKLDKNCKEDKELHQTFWQKVIRLICKK